MDAVPYCFWWLVSDASLKFFFFFIDFNLIFHIPKIRLIHVIMILLFNYYVFCTETIAWFEISFLFLIPSLKLRKKINCLDLVVCINWFAPLTTLQQLYQSKMSQPIQPIYITTIYFIWICHVDFMTSSLLTGSNSPQTQSFEVGNPTSTVIVSKLTE